jgi:hypothetical protein
MLSRQYCYAAVAGRMVLYYMLHVLALAASVQASTVTLNSDLYLRTEDRRGVLVSLADGMCYYMSLHTSEPMYCDQTMAILGMKFNQRPVTIREAVLAFQYSRCPPNAEFCYMQIAGHHKVRCLPAEGNNSNCVQGFTNSHLACSCVADRAL